MKINRIISVLCLTLFFIALYMEAEAVRPPLTPLNREQFKKMIADADVIATGTVTCVTQSKTLQPPLETVMVHVTVTPEKILKGDRLMDRIAIVESYQQYAVDTDASAVRGATDKSVTVQISGPAPPVGRYREGERILVLLKAMDGLNQYRPLGSGNYDAYLGVFQITPDGVTSDRYRFDDAVDRYARSEVEFLNFISAIKGE
jgi:hypothetical protein